MAGYLRTLKHASYKREKCERKDLPSDIEEGEGLGA